MNILFIGHEDKLNGASRSMLNLIDQMCADHTIYVLTSYSSGPFYEQLKQRDVSVLVHPFYRWCVYKGSWKSWLKQNVLWRVHHNFVNEKTAKIVAQIVRDKNIDIIHTNTGVLDIGARISRYSGVRHVWHIREFADLDFNMYPLLNTNSYQSQMNNGADRFVCISRAICAHYPYLDEKKKRVIYNGVDGTNILTEHTTSEKVQLLIAGRIGAAKGQWDAVRACKLLVDRGIDNFVLNLAGTGDLGHPVFPEVEKHVNFLGQISDMPSLRKGIDIELVCSRAEGFGRVTAEAMMGSIPVIGANTGGTTELIQHGHTGLLYAYGNVEELADCLETLITDPQKRAEMGCNAGNYAQEHFTIERCAGELLALYRELLND